MNTIQITQCPSCGSTHIKHRQETITGNYRGQSYLVPDVSFYECLDCQEKLYDREAIRTIEQYSPAFKTRLPVKKALSRPHKQRRQTKKTLPQHLVTS